MHKFQIYVNPHCHDCDSLIAVMQTMVQHRGFPKANLVNVLGHVDTAVTLRITRVPALVFADRVIVQGAVTEAQLEKCLDQGIATGEQPND